MESNSGPEKTQQTSNLQEIQDAVSPVNIGDHLRRRLPNICRSDGGIPPRAYPAISPEVPTVPLRGPVLSVQGSTIWPILNAQDFHQIADSTGGTLRAILVRVQCYLDDILIQCSSPLRATENLQVTIQVLQDHGFSINFKKSHLALTNRLQHLGVVIDTIPCEVSLSQECQTSLQALENWILTKAVPLALLSQLLGKMVSCISIVPWARLHAGS